MSLAFLIKLYERYKSAKLNKSIEKIKKETYSMLLEIDNKLEDLQNKEYTSTNDWENNWKHLYEIRDTVFVTIGNIRTPNVSSNLSKRIDEYKIIQNSSIKLSEMVSYAGEKVNDLENKLTEEKITELVNYTRQVSDFSGITDKDSILNEKLSRQNAKNYMVGILKKIENYPTDYSPNGKILPEKKMNVKKDLKKLKLKAKRKDRGLGKFEIKCLYSNKMPSNEELQNKALKLNPKKIAQIVCYITNEVDNHTKKIFENFEHNAMSIFCYELKTNSLVYNKKFEPNSYFLGYFDPKQKPKNLKGFLEDFSEKGIINEIQLKNLNLYDSLSELRNRRILIQDAYQKYKTMEG